MTFQSRKSKLSAARGTMRDYQQGLAQTRRRGSTLMIVMVLMGMLSLLGVIFYVFAAQERSNANYYAEAAKVTNASSLTADVLFDWALEQIIVGTDQRLTNSMLWGSRYSMLSNELGFGYHRPGDLHPFNGEGLNLIYDSFGNLAIDQNRDGIADSSVAPNSLNVANLLNFIDSPAAQNTPAQQLANQTMVQRNLTYNEDLNGNWLLDPGEDTNNNGLLDRFPQSDVGYTYPDVNNLFVAYVAKIRDSAGHLHRVVKPSYLVPGMLRAHNPTATAVAPAPLLFEDANFNGVLDSGEDINGNGYLDDWCVNPNTVAQSMRAHYWHLYVPPSSTNQPSVRRYLSETEAISLIGANAHGFPFHPMDPTYNTTTGGIGLVYNNGQMGPYSNFDVTGANPANEPIEFDYDNDGDGFREAILLDLDFPAQQDASGKLYVPMYLITIHDLDSLVNLNVHGNLSKILFGPADILSASTAVSSGTGSPFGYDSNLAGFDFISKSNLGLGPAEINPVWALNARPPISASGYLGDGTGGGFTTHTSFFGGNPTNNSPNPQWGETGNMEHLFVKVGVPTYSAGNITNITAGVYGEEGYLYQSLSNGTVSSPGGLHGGVSTLPRPGYSLADDNGDIQEGQTTPPAATTSPFFTLTTWDFQHPMDWTGQGSYLSPGNVKALNWNYTPTAGTGPNVWIKYTGYGNSSTTTTGNVRWGQNSTVTPPVQFMANTLTQGLGDDPYETLFYPASSSQGASDNLLDPSEMLYLQLSNSENIRLSNTSRLTSLVPFNFSTNSTNNARGESIRHKFTTESNDRKNYSLPTTARTLGSTILPNTPASVARANQIAGQEFTPDNVYNYYTPANTPNPPQPFLGNAPDRVTFRFPPEFGNAAGASPAIPPTFVQRYQIYQAGPPIVAADPFRPYTRALLEMDSNYASSIAGIQQRLSVNKLLTVDPVTGNYIFRSLTPHPDDPGTALIGGTAAPAYPPTTPAAQEYWARLDRQQLCRDIYVLLYLLGHGDDTVNTALTANLNSSVNGGNPTAYTTSPANGQIVYSEPQMREMAQFAVNLVDSMDRDSVITRFEYDKDLSDGWNLDDDATTNDPATVYPAGANYNVNYPRDSATRGEVFGVESLDMTISEALFINTTNLTGIAMPANSPITPYDDTTSRNFAYVEVMNRSPQTINFSNTEAWQIVIKFDGGAGGGAFERRLSLRGGAPSISPGQTLTFASADFSIGGATPGRSTFKCDPGGTDNPQGIQSLAPATAITATSGLDLVDEAVNGTLTGKVRIEDGTSPTPTDMSLTMGAWANGLNGTSLTGSTTMRIILRRRASPNRTYVAPTTAAIINDNPWVDVDAMTITVNPFNLKDPAAAGSGSLQANVTGNPFPGTTPKPQLNQQVSRSRNQPLDRANETNFTAVATGVNNSLGNVAGGNQLATYTIWQPHFDREFASIGELFMVPVYAPYQLTMAAGSAQNDAPEVQVGNPVGSATLTPDWPYEAAGSTPTANSLSAKTAAAKFMVPEDPSNFNSASPARYLDNRWHRLLEFIEVPTRTNSNLGIGTDVTIPRVPGKMNLNMLRFPDNYAALLDEGKVAKLNLSPTSVLIDTTSDPLATIDDQLTETSRDWWQQFILSRDGHDPYLYGAYTLEVPLPGNPPWPSQNINGNTTSIIGARPFRSLGDIRYNSLTPLLSPPLTPPVQHASIEDTILRSLPFDYTIASDPITSYTKPSPKTRRRLMEIGINVGTTHDHNTAGNVDPMIRHRLLSKVWGNTTTRSNCFGVFISVKYFSAVNQNGAIRIGGPYNGTPSPEHRGFFVVDRSKIEQGRTSNQMGYDFRAFVDYRKTLATQ